MLSGSITLFVWAGIFLIMDIVVFVYAIRFLLSAQKTKEDVEKMAKVAEIRLQRQYNKIATLPYDEFNSYMIATFSKAMEVVANREISKSDPDGDVSLYALATAEMVKYIGPETIEAIEYYYGKDYITRWSLLSYEMLEKRGIIKAIIISKEARSETIAKMLG